MASPVFNYIALVGFLLSALSYLAHTFVKFEGIPFIIGMLLISSGYEALFSSKLIAIIKERKQSHDKKTDAPSKDEEENPKPKLDVQTLLQYFGYALLAIFFTLIFFKREFTLQFRIYDPLAAIGNFMMLFTKYIPVSIAVFPLILYYLFGGLIKVREEGWINKLQLVARMLLMTYYGATFMSSLHLF